MPIHVSVAYLLTCCQWHAKCVPPELIPRSSASQTADGILRCGLSVSTLRFPLCGVRPRGLTTIKVPTLVFTCNTAGLEAMPVQLIVYSCTVERSTMVFKPAGNVTQFERLEKAPTYQEFGCTQKLRRY